MLQTPPRLHVLLARDADVGVVFRRGPSKRVATLLWDRRRDRFALGQWLHGRIYERRSDLSPDGRHLIYFAMNGRFHEPPARGAWTAISRAPYLKAVALYPKGNCWNGGGLWVDRKRYWVNGAHDAVILRNQPDVGQANSYEPVGGDGNECLGVYFPRLIRDGWRRVEPPTPAPRGDWLAAFERDVGHGWTLQKLAHAQIGAPIGKGCYWDEHALLHAATGRRERHPDWEWADVDRDRLVWASGGRLYAGRIRGAGLADARELFDFTPMQFEPIAAPY